MHRRVSRRTVARLAYAVPMVAMSMPVAVLATPADVCVDCYFDDQGSPIPFTFVNIASTYGCLSCDPRAATGTQCEGTVITTVAAGIKGCRLPENITMTVDCRVAIRPPCRACDDVTGSCLSH